VNLGTFIVIDSGSILYRDPDHQQILTHLSLQGHVDHLPEAFQQNRLITSGHIWGSQEMIIDTTGTTGCEHLKQLLLRSSTYKCKYTEQCDCIE